MMPNSSCSSFKWAHLPLSLSEACLFAEQKIVINVKSNCFMASFSSPLFGNLGPFEPGQILQLPLHVIDILIKERIVTPEIPTWLQQDGLKKLIKQENATQGLCKYPHFYYIEIAHFFLRRSFDFWNSQYNNKQNYELVMNLFQDYVSLRRHKILQLNETLIRDRNFASTVISNFELKRLSVLCMDYLDKLDATPSICCEPLEDILASLNVFNAEEHYALQTKAQEMCMEAASSDSINP